MQEIVLFLKACVKKVELSGKMLNKYFLLVSTDIQPLNREGFDLEATEKDQHFIAFFVEKKGR